MNRYVVTLLATAGLLVSGGCGADTSSASTYTVLDDAATQLREDFNNAKGLVRLIFVVDPICPGCLRGLDDVNKALLAKTRDPRLQTFVVHVPVLRPPPKAKDVPPAAELVRNPHVRHYWNESGAFGGLLSNAVDLRSNDGKWVYAWDVWLIYGPEAVWEGAAPPQPKLLMQQLWALGGSTRFPRFKPEVFAKEVQKVLASTTPLTTTQ